VFSIDQKAASVPPDNKERGGITHRSKGLASPWRPLSLFLRASSVDHFTKGRRNKRWFW
jgi:hypothetical protein